MSIEFHEARSIIRKAKRRVPEGEAITHLNITPMMDMMTILLVFMIKSMAVQTTALSLNDVTLPSSTTHQPPPEEAVSIVIAREALLVEGEPLVKIKNGDVDASEKTAGSFGIEIAKLKDNLTKQHTRIKKIAAARGAEATNDITIVADRNTPYRLLAAVMYTAGQAEFSNYRLIVLRTEE
jgi:biopolymer transport protein ExbD